MCISFLSGVEEEHILKGEYFVGEWESVLKAFQILKTSRIFFECIPYFTMKKLKQQLKNI